VDTEVNAVEEDRLLHIRTEVDIIDFEDFIIKVYSAAEEGGYGNRQLTRSLYFIINYEKSYLAFSMSGFGDKTLATRR